MRGCFTSFFSEPLSGHEIWIVYKTTIVCTLQLRLLYSLFYYAAMSESAETAVFQKGVSIWTGGGKGGVPLFSIEPKKVS